MPSTTEEQVEDHPTPDARSVIDRTFNHSEDCDGGGWVFEHENLQPVDQGQHP
jgi:hypothetical protein